MAEQIQRAESLEKFLESMALRPDEVKKHYVTGGMEVWYPYIDQASGRPKIGRVRIMKDK